MAPVETEYYNLLGVGTDVKDTDLKKAYRKETMKYHPDKNPAPDAEEKFKEISKAYQILSNPDLRAIYDKNGKDMAGKEDGVGTESPVELFASVFGGERFRDWIGEIAILKDMVEVARVATPDEEGTETKEDVNTDPRAIGTTNRPYDENVSATPASEMAPPVPERNRDASSNSSKISSKNKNLKEREKIILGQRQAKLQELDRNRRKAMEERIVCLTEILLEVIRPFVEAKHPGDKDDPETIAFELRIKRDADNLKLESFGVELLHTIGTVYMSKSVIFLKSQKRLSLSGFWSRLVFLAKDTWRGTGGPFRVQPMIQELVKLQATGEAEEQELRAWELDIAGNIMLSSWRGTRLEVIQVLQEVCENILKDRECSQLMLNNRAKALLIMGAIFKSTVPDESDEPYRKLERMTAETAAGKSRHLQFQAAVMRK